MTGTLDALLRAILANPADDTPRLVWADAAEEAGLGDRAEFVRVQCELAKIADDEHPDLEYGGYEQYKARQDALRRRERKLWASVGGRIQCVRNDPGHYVTWRCDLADVRRGFRWRAECTAADWLAHGDKLAWRPGWTDECGRCGGDGKAHGSDRPLEWSGPGTYPGPCPARCNKGRVPRPCPPMAQPVERVRLTTTPPEFDPYYGDAGVWGVVQRYSSAERFFETDRYPGIIFELPPAGG